MTKTVKYPKYTRIQDLRCKLTDEDIAEIRRRFRSGEIQADLGRFYNVNRATIWYWTRSEEEIKEFAKVKNKNKTKIKKLPKYNKKFRERKERKMQKEFKSWEDYSKKHYVENNKEKLSEKSKVYYRKKKSKLTPLL